MSSLRTFAVVCAAGRSTRMGRQKLLLPWRGKPLIAPVLDACTQSRIDRTLVVVRSDDAPLIDVCRKWDVHLVLSDRQSADMKASVVIALEAIARQYQPAELDAWLLLPADAAGVSCRTIDRLITAYDAASEKLIVPIADGRRGHPLVLSWSCAEEVKSLGQGEGVNKLMARHPIQKVTCDETVLLDIDTPGDYARLLSDDED